MSEAVVRGVCLGRFADGAGRSHAVLGARCGCRLVTAMGPEDMYVVMAVGGDRARWSDEQLLAAIASCDGDEFSVFYRRHLTQTVGYLLRETRDREVTADLAAEVFSAVLLCARRYRPERDTALNPCAPKATRRTAFVS
jgi:hypothetical protein